MKTIKKNHKPIKNHKIDYQCYMLFFKEKVNIFMNLISNYQ